MHFKKLLSTRVKCICSDLMQSAKETFSHMGDIFDDSNVISLYSANSLNPPPQYIYNFLASERWSDNFYTSTKGNTDLLAALSTKAVSEKITFSSSENIAITAGGSNGFAALSYALLDEGDIILALAPTHILFANTVHAFGGRMELVEATFDQQENRYRVTPQTLAQTIEYFEEQGKQIKALFVVNPRNVDGDVLTENDISELAPLIEHKDLLVIEDRVYKGLQYDFGRGKATFFAHHPLTHKRTLTIDSVSKRYGATQWRLGWIYGPETIIEAAKEYVMQSIWSPAEKYQKCAAQMIRAELAEGDQNIQQEHVRYFKNIHETYSKRRDLSLLLINGRKQYNKLRCNYPGLRSIHELLTIYHDSLQKKSIDLSGIKGMRTPVIPCAAMFILMQAESDLFKRIPSSIPLKDLIFTRIVYRQLNIAMLPPNDLTLPKEDNLFRVEFGIDINDLLTAYGRLQKFMNLWMTAEDHIIAEMVDDALKGIAKEKFALEYISESESYSNKTPYKIKRSA